MARKVQVNNTLTLDMKLPGTNQVLQLTKAHRWDWDKLKKKVTTSVIRALIQQKCVPPEPYRKIRVSYKFYEKADGARDPDNILFGMKFISDAFVAVGIVEDDDIWHVELGTFNFIPCGEFKVEVSWEIVE